MATLAELVPIHKGSVVEADAERIMQCAHEVADAAEDERSARIFDMNREQPTTHASPSMTRAARGRCPTASSPSQWDLAPGLRRRLWDWEDDGSGGGGGGGRTEVGRMEGQSSGPPPQINGPVLRQEVPQLKPGSEGKWQGGGFEYYG